MGYKETNISWIGAIPSDWTVKKIKNSGSLSGRIGWQGLTSDEYTSEGAYLITGIDFKDGVIDWDSCVHVPMKRWIEATGVQIKENDLLITKDGTVGKVAIVKNMPYETSLNSGVLLIRLEKEIYTKYLYYVLLSDVFWDWFNQVNAGNSTIIHLYQHDFNNFSFACPIFEKQKKITEYLDEKVYSINETIKKIETQIETLRMYKTALITEAVTQGIQESPKKNINLKSIKTISNNYSIQKIKYVCNVYSGNSISDDDKPNFENKTNSKPYISSKDINVNTHNIDYDNGMYIPNDNLNFKVARKDSVLMCIEGGSAGRKIGYLNEDVCFVNKLCCFDCKKINSRYLYYSLMSNYFTEEFFLNISGLIGGVSVSTIKNMNIVYPPMIEQGEIVKYLDNKCKFIEELINKKELALSNLIKYKKSLIYECVTGKKNVEVE